jgi:hypothetical protein
MRNILLTIVGVVSLSAMLAFRIVDDATAMLKKLGLTDQDARQNIWNSIQGKYLSYSNSETLKAIVKGDRPALVLQIAEYAKAYAKSEEFKRQYDQLREDNKPTPPEPPKTVAQQRFEMKKELTRSIAESDSTMKMFSKEQQESMAPMIEALRQQLKAVDDPDNPMFSKQMEEMGKQAYASALEEHKRKIQEWNEQYPESPTKMIRSFLETFLEESADVDYKAELIDGPNGKKLFASTVHEMKSNHWKMCYRAGRETVDAGRKAAQRWLSELKQSK